MMYEHWMKPPIFEESKHFFEICPVPIYIVSNIERIDILKAVEFHDLKPVAIFTSEDAKSYKPRKELFEYALNSTGLKAEQIVHIGDSLSSDIKVTASIGLNAVWINRRGKEVPQGIMAISNLLDRYI